MAERLDMILFGVTGFTGLHALPIVHKLSKSNGRNLTWGVSGRSESKIKEILEKIGKENEIDLCDVPIIVADVKNEESLKAMTARARIIINCCGPYRFLGEQVARACLANGTHMVDVSGEPQYIERLQLEQHEAASEKGVYMISACGFDSIPADLGIVYLEQQFEGTLNSIETFLSGEVEGDAKIGGPTINFTTWESAVYGLGHADELRGLRKKLFPKRLPQFRPKLEQKKLPHKSPHVNGWIVPFLGSDRSIIRRSQRHFYEVEKKRPIQVETYVAINSFLWLCIAAVFGGLFAILARFSFGRYLLLNYPGFFSCGFFGKGSPSEEKLERSVFEITLYGEGWKEKLAEADDSYASPVNRSILGKVSGRNPGYGATCVALVLSAITVITETDKMPGKGGVYAPGAAFAKTSLIKELNENGLKFEIIEKKDIQTNIKHKI